MTPFLLLCLAANGFDISAQVTPPEGGKLRVGEPFTVVLEATHSPGNIALLPEKLDLPDTLGERPAARKHTRSTQGSQERDHYELEFLAFEAGQLEIPAIPLAIGSTQAATKPLTIEVESSLAEDERLVASSTRPEALGELEKMSASDPRALEIRVRDYTLLFVLLGLLGVGAAVYLYLRFRKKKAEQPAPVPELPPIPAHEIALERLQALSKSPTLQRGELKPFYIELSEILRAYVGGRYGFDSVELTIRELIDELNARGADGLDLRTLQKVLDEADLVKFAKFETTVEDARSHLSTAIGLVKRSAPKGDT